MHYPPAQLKTVEELIGALTTWTVESLSDTLPTVLFVWVTLPQRMDAAALLPRAIEEAKVAFVPGRAFHMDGSGHSTLRLNFSLNRPAAIAEGIGRLAALIARA
jgi:DNA-binding transcriptional MocR family regulator